MMQRSKGNVLLGVTGGIAAYKAAELVRLLRQSGFVVNVVMTRAAQQFVAPLTFQALTGNPVHCELLDSTAEAGMGHIELARWADLLLIAPATADFIAKLAHGLADDLLSTLCLATSAPIAVAPAMNQAMWRNAATQHNVAVLRDRSIQVWGPEEGEQACGDVGPGRLLQPNVLHENVCDHFLSEQHDVIDRPALQGVRVLITAGPTRESLDPVRYISNHSSGKMGFALARAAREAGAQVDLVAGPTQLTPFDQVSLHSVESADEMLQQCLDLANTTDVFIAAAAVADFRADDIARQKLKKEPGQTEWVLRLVPNPDILATVARLPKAPMCIGFAAETQDVIANAKSKLERKGVAMIIANNVAQPGIGFNSDENAVSVVMAQSVVDIKQQNKMTLARELMQLIAVEFAKLKAIQN